jgi:hypothetical protein
MDEKELKIIHAIAADPRGYAMVKSNSKALKALVASGHVETNPDMKHGLDIAARLTETGKQATANTGGAPQQQEAQNTMTNTAAPAVAVVTGFVPPAKAPAKTRTKNTFGGLFDQAPVGGSFFVAAATDVKHPNRAVKLAARAYARAGVKRFDVYVVENGKQYGEFTAPADGAVVVRTADADGPAPAVPRRAKKAA